MTTGQSHIVTDFIRKHLNRKIFHIFVSFPIKFYSLRNILPGAIYTLVVFMLCCRNCVMHVRQLSALQLLIWASYRHLYSF